MTNAKDLDLPSLKEALLLRKKELEDISAQSKETREPVELDQTVQGRLSRQDALQQQEMAKATERRRQNDLYRTIKALERIETEDFGYCLSCDEEIEKKRLELDPAILTCVACASQA